MLNKILKYLSVNDFNCVYSCLIDDQPKFYLQGYYFVLALVKIAKVSGSRIYIHMTTKNLEFESLVSQYGVNIVYVQPWGDKKYCNKLAQLDTPALLKADYVFLCDADLAILEDLYDLASKNKNKILGKLVDFPNPPLEQLEVIYDHFALQYPKISYETLTGEPSFEGNFNGGLYGIPGKYVETFGRKWKLYATEMLKSEKIKNILGKKTIHIDQISFSLALNDLCLEYLTLDYEYNCPTHLKDMSLLDSKLSQDVKIIHYHSSLDNTGLLKKHNQRFLAGPIGKVNNILRENFDNSLFWSYRYASNPELGSGVGSRGDVAIYKINLLKRVGVETDKNILDMGCGDLEIISRLKLNNYSGVDVADEAIKNARIKHPEKSFYNFKDQRNAIPKADTVLCLDVLIHQSKNAEYDDVISFISQQANHRVIVSGYEKPVDSSHMCFFYESLRESLIRQGCFKYVFKIGSYRGLAVFVADKGKLQATENKNDITNDVLADFIASYDDKDLLLETVACSRASFGWYTKHYPRMYEYPWLLKQLDGNLGGKVVADFGAGVTPLPLLLAGRGATVITVDNHKTKHKLEAVHQASEWGFFDYSVLDESITSLNKTLDVDTFEPASVDVWYSISVVEHMPAIIRREVLRLMSNTLKPEGKLLLTLDLVKNQTLLWNRSEGKVVENEQEHGDLDTIVSELKSLGFVVEYLETFNMPETERVDLAMLVARKN